jgi:ubiquitin-protein ligase
VTFNDVILADFLTPLQVEARKIERRLQYDRTVTDRNKHILSECANMRTSLDDGTFDIVAESRPDMMRALIVRPEDTPYANGPFK